jgi:hypothetical protein
MSNNDSFKIPDSPAPKKRGRPPKSQSSSPSTTASPSRSSSDNDSPMSSPVNVRRLTRQFKDTLNSSDDSNAELNNAFIDLTDSPKKKQSKKDGQQVYNSPIAPTTSTRKATRRDYECHLNFDFQNKEPTPFHEKQLGAQCGLHALRNALQIDAHLDRAYMERAGEDLRQIKPSTIRDGYYYDVVNGGWYSSFLMQEVMDKFGLAIKSYNILPIMHPIRRKNNPTPCIIIVTHLGSPGTEHYFALRRFFQGGSLWNLDSFIDEPRKVPNDYVENLLKISGYTAIAISIPENHYFARECNLKFTHQNKQLDLQPDTWPFQLEQQQQQPTQIATQQAVDPISQTDSIIENMPDSEIDIEVELALQNNSIGYSQDFIQLMHSDQRLYIGSFLELLETYDLQLLDVPSDGHCFISTIIKFFDIFHQQKYTIQQVQNNYFDLLNNEDTNSQIFETYRVMKIDSLSRTTPEGLQINYSNQEINNHMWHDHQRYFREKQFVDNDYLDIIIQYACKVFKIDILIIQCNYEVNDTSAITEYMLLRNLNNEPLHGNSFITLFRTSTYDNSHYQLLIPASYDINSTTRDNMIRQLIDIKTNEYIDLKCDSETQSLASNDSISQDSNSSLSSNASINSSASSTNSQKKFKRKTHFSSGKKDKKAVLKNLKAFEKRQRETESQKDERRKIARERYARKSEIEKDLLRVNDKYWKQVERSKIPESSKKVINLLKKIWHLHNLLKETPEQEAIRLSKKKIDKAEQRKKETEKEKLARLEKDAKAHVENYESMSANEKIDYIKKVTSLREQESEDQKAVRLEKQRKYDRERRAKMTEDQKQYVKDYQKNYREFAKERKKNEKIDYEHCPGYFDRNNFDEDQYVEHYLGPMNQECLHCGSLNFEAEKVDGHFSICCHNGKIKLETPMWPRALSNLYEGKGLPHEVAAKAKERKPKFVVEPEWPEKTKIAKSSNDFGENIRTYNNSFAFASTSVKLPEPFRNMKNNAGNTFVKIQGKF